MDTDSVSQVGAATFGNGDTGVTGVVSASNSLIGSTISDQVSKNQTILNEGVTALTNGNYVVSSFNWDNGAAQDAGAVTFANGLTGITGVVSPSNSLVGTTAGDFISVRGITVLSNGNYVVISPGWNANNFGAVTLGNGETGIVGAISASNSLVGSSSNDNVGSGGVTAVANGNYIVSSSVWNNGLFVDTGAISLLNGNVSNFSPYSKTNRDNLRKWQESNLNNVGAINSTNSVLGTTANGGPTMTFAFDSENNQLVVGRAFDNIVTIFRLTPTAASATISGKVRTANGRGIPRAIVSISDPNGQIRYARTNPFDYFHFEGIGVGETYVFNAYAKAYTFATQVLKSEQPTEEESHER